MDLFQELRSATQTVHNEIEQLPAAVAMLSGTVRRDEYTSVLARVYWIHSIFETELLSLDDLAHHWPNEAFRADAIARDLANLEASLISEPPPAVEEWAEQLRRSAETSPAVWAGAGYVLEGSRMGSRVLIGPVSQALGVTIAPGVGVDYHLEGLSDPGGRWKRVREAILTADRTPSDRMAIVSAAIATFEVMAAVHCTDGVVVHESVPLLATQV